MSITGIETAVRRAVRPGPGILALAAARVAGRVAAASVAIVTFAGAVAAALMLAVFGTPAVSAQTFELTDYTGAELFDRFCAACHGPEGRGNGPVASTLNVLVPDLSRLATRNGGDFPARDVRDIVDGRAVVIAHGPRSMPVWGYEFWIEEGGDIEAEAVASELIDRLVLHVESIQRDTEPGRPVQ